MFAARCPYRCAGSVCRWSCWSARARLAGLDRRASSGVPTRVSPSRSATRPCSNWTGSGVLRAGRGARACRPWCPAPAALDASPQLTLFASGSRSSSCIALQGSNPSCVPSHRASGCPDTRSRRTGYSRLPCSATTVLSAEASWPAVTTGGTGAGLGDAGAGGADRRAGRPPWRADRAAAGHHGGVDRLPVGRTGRSTSGQRRSSTRRDRD
jgi:hypothetical protein